MSTSAQADQGQVQGMLVRVKPSRPKGDGSLRFDIVCHNTKRRVVYRERFILSSKEQKLQEVAKSAKGRLVHVVFAVTGRERNHPINILVV